MDKYKYKLSKSFTNDQIEIDYSWLSKGIYKNARTIESLKES